MGNGAKAAFEGSTETASANSLRDGPPATSDDAAAPSDASSHSKTSPQADELHSDMQNLSVAQNPLPDHANTNSATDDARSTDSFESAKERLSVEEAPVAKTAEGPPAGPVVFDHPPSQAEQQQAEKLMQDVEKTA